MTLVSINTVLSVIPDLISIFALIAFNRTSEKKAWVIASIIYLSGIIPLVVLSTNSFSTIEILFSASLNLLGVIVFFVIFARFERRRLIDYRQALKGLEIREQDQEKNRIALKTLMEKSKREIDKSLSLYGAIKGIGAALTWDQMVPHIDFAVKQCLGIQDYQLFLLDESDSGGAKKSDFQKVLSRGVKMADAVIQPQLSKPQFHQKSNDFYLEAPIFHGEKQIGLLWLKIPRSQTESKEEILTDAADLSEELGMGLQKAQFFSSLERLSRIDGLTGVYRRQIFNERLDQEIRRAMMFRTSFSVMIGDLDHFKNINDTYGHQAGDEVLRRIGKVMKENVYETDFVARYGGEEFVILFPQADPIGVKRKAESLREKIAKENFLFGWNQISVTMSMGIAHFPNDGNDGTALLSAADQFLYKAKTGGRNRVIDSSS